jgi:uncharacterized Tic20 family protein
MMSYQPGPPATPGPEERNWALASHVGTLVAAAVALAFLAPLIVMLVKGKDSPFVRRHSVESLNFQISCYIYGAAAMLIVLLTLGLGAIVIVPVGLVAAVAYLVLIVMATIKAANGEEYRYPLTIRLVS